MREKYMPLKNKRVFRIVNTVVIVFLMCATAVSAQRTDHDETHSTYSDMSEYSIRFYDVVGNDSIYYFDSDIYGTHIMALNGIDRSITHYGNTTMMRNLTMSEFTMPGFVKNDANGNLSGGNKVNISDVQLWGFNNTYLLLNGSNADQDIDIGVYNFTANYFNGSGLFLININASNIIGNLSLENISANNFSQYNDHGIHFLDDVNIEINKYLYVGNAGAYIRGFNDNLYLGSQSDIFFGMNGVSWKLEKYSTGIGFSLLGLGDEGFFCSEDWIPQIDGKDLGNASNRWDLYANDVDVSGDITVSGTSYLGDIVLDVSNISSENISANNFTQYNDHGIHFLDVANFTDDVMIDEYIRWADNPETYIRFLNDNFWFFIDGISTLHTGQLAPTEDYVTVGGSGEDVDFFVHNGLEDPLFYVDCYHDFGNGKVFIYSDADVDGDLSIGGDLTVVDEVLSDLLPDPTLTHDLGSGPNRWKTIFVQDVNAENIDTLFITGDGSGLTNINASNVTGTMSLENISCNNISEFTPGYGIHLLDNVTVDGTTQLNDTLTVGVSGTGHDVQFWGDTADWGMLWDQSDNSLKIVSTLQAVATKLKFMNSGEQGSIYYYFSMATSVRGMYYTSDSNMHFSANGGAGDIRFDAQEVFMVDDVALALGTGSLGTPDFKIFYKSADGTVQFQPQSPGINPAPVAVVFNELSKNTDLRVEGNNDAYTFFLDAGLDMIGLSDGTPVALLDVGGGVADYIDGVDDLIVADDVEVDGDAYVAGDVNISGITNSTGGFATDVGPGLTFTFTCTEGIVTVTNGIITGKDW